MTTEFADSSWRALAHRILTRSDMLRGTAETTLERFVETGRIMKFADANLLSSYGQPIETLLVVLSGALEIGVSTLAGKHFVIAYLGAGLIYGLIPIIDGGGSLYDARAHGEAVVLGIPRDVVLEALRQDPGLAHAFLLLFCKRSRVLYGGASANALAPFRVRVARALASLLPVHGITRGETVTLALKLSQEEFGALLGASRQAVNRELKALESAGVVSLAYSTIQVLDCDALGKIAEFDDGVVRDVSIRP